MKNKEFKFIAILLIVLLGIFGGTARLRPDSDGDTLSYLPSVQEQTKPDSPADKPAQDVPVQPQDTPELPEESTMPEPTPTPEPEYFTLHFIGDCTLACNEYYQGTAQGYDTVLNGDYAYPFAKTLEYFINDDFTFANLECSLTDSNDRTDKTFTFKTSADYAKVMTEGSVEFVTLANNHVLDYGQQGYADTKAAVEAEGLGYVGRDEYAVYETESGLRIGVYGLSFGTVDQIKAGIAALKELDVDFIIAAMHWGDEGSYHVNSEQITLAHACIDAGADFVYGSHPHTLQPIEEYKGKFIYYSMGNWTFGGNTNPRDKDTFILRMVLEMSADGSVTVFSREHIPCASSGVLDGNNYQPVPYEEGSEEYLRTLSKLDGSFTGQDLSIGYGYSNNE